MMKKLSLFLVLTFTLSVFSLKAENDKVQFIAIHIGNADNMSVLDKTAFPDFKFYSNDEPLILYDEAQKIIGNSKYLTGYYGEVPEKMGFGANYRLEKGHGAPHYTGALYVVDPNNIIGYQSASNYAYIQFDKCETAVRKFKRGKYAKALKAKKQTYLKESAIGELEKTKGSDLDKDGNGLVGWNVPDINLKDENGASVKLKDLTDGKITILVFFTLNGAHYKSATAKGVIDKEWDGVKLKAPESIFEDEFMEGEYTDKSEAKKGFAKAMFKSAAASNGLAALIVLDKGERSDIALMGAYTSAVGFISKVQERAKALKK